MEHNLPPVALGKRIAFPHFPTAQQALVFRNWEMIPAERLAAVLETTESNVLALAAGLGLPDRRPDPAWLAKGYLTIIRNNWHLLPYGQLEQLLGWDREQLAFVLKEDDFLAHKLGMAKPDVPAIRYRPLTAGEEARTARLRDWLAPLRAEPCPGEREPFAFSYAAVPPVREPAAPLPGQVTVDGSWGLDYDRQDPRIAQYARDFREEYLRVAGVALADRPADKQITLALGSLPDAGPESHVIAVSREEIKLRAQEPAGLFRGLLWLTREAGEKGGPRYEPGVLRRDARQRLRIIYSYCAIYGDCTPDILDQSFPDELLRSYACAGINGVWLQALLYRLTEFPFRPSLSRGREERLAALRSLIRRAGRYGVRIYLYLNEPRSMPEEFFREFPQLKGEREHYFHALCTSAPEVQEYLRRGVADVARALPGLGGFITITMSENLTNCHSRTTPDRIACPRCRERKPWEVAAEVNRLIAEGAGEADPAMEVIAWTWGWRDREFIDKGIALMPPSVRVMATSEEGVEKEIRGVRTAVIDYSISIPGPGEKALSTFETARRLGHPVAAKVQFNNTWECAAVPYIPAFGLVMGHAAGLKNADALMLGWTLGGYPSVTLRMLADSYFGGPIDLAAAAGRIFGELAGPALEASALFSRAFGHFPFHIGTLYAAPQNYGPANLFYPQPTGWTATMIGYPYDDVETWRSVFPVEDFRAELRLLWEQWGRGLALLEGLEGNQDFTDFCQVAEACYCHFRSTYNALEFTILRDAGGSGEALGEILQAERAVTERLYRIVRLNPHIGYEASNHYFYSRHSLLEKLANLRWLEEEWLPGRP